MSWYNYGTIPALYLGVLFTLLALWPGLIAQEEAQRVKRLFCRYLLVHMAWFVALMCMDMVLLTFHGRMTWVDHFRRVFGRWSLVALHGWLAWALWQSRVLQRLHWRQGMVGLCLVGSLLLGGAAPQPELPIPVYGNSRSHIYHAPWCRNYPNATQRAVGQHWRAFESAAVAESQGYRRALNCPAMKPE